VILDTTAISHNACIEIIVTAAQDLFSAAAGSSGGS
jgi:hypothetical protein